MLLEFVYRVEKWCLCGYNFRHDPRTKRKPRIELHEPHQLPRPDSPVEMVEGELLMRVLVPSLEIRRLGGFGLLDEKGLAAFVMLIERIGERHGEGF
jgi:hypothetical protein